MIFQKELIKSLKLNSNRTAILSNAESISYGDLLNSSNRITRFLLRENLPKEALVGIQLEDIPQLICSMIGILNARCVFVPINSALPPKRIEGMIKDLNLQYLITSRDKKLNSNDYALKNYFFEDMHEGEGEVLMGEDEYPQFDENDSIYIYFTSGTTGKPKGIVGRNSSLLQYLRWEMREFDIDYTFRFSQFISPYFDAFLRDIFVPLLAGARICMPPVEDDFFSTEKMTAWISANEISIIHCVPSVFRIINTEASQSSDFKALKYILLSGERVIPTELTNWYKIFGSRIQLVNLYGATETTMIRSSYRMSPSDVQLSKIPIGAPIDDTELLILNEDLKPCNKLIPGDLYIVSRYVTKGYFNLPELNNQKFIKLKMGKDPQAIAFRTGDKARMLATGQIDLLGREDRQIKLRGIRIELDEIENTIAQVNFVKNVAALVNDDDKANEAIIVFVKTSELTISENEAKAVIGKCIKDNLPDYMAPANVLIIKEFPLLTNGKMDYKALINQLAGSEIKTPIDIVESDLLQIWKEILGDKPISTTDSFQILGGNSLSIMKLIGKIYSKYSVRVPLSELFKNLTIQKQALLIKSLNTDKSLTINKAEEKPAYFLSSAQERIYYNYAFNKQSTAFNIPLAWEIQGVLDLVKIEDTLQLLIRRHEGLRTRFKHQDGRVLQIIEREVDFKLEKIEVINENLRNVIADFIKPFDLDNAPLIRCAIILAAGDRKYFLFDVHHIVCDGISQVNLFSDFLKLYNGQVLGELKVQYKDFAEWESTFKKTNHYISQRAFWVNCFEDEVPRLALPTVASIATTTSDKGGNVKFQIAKEEFVPILKILESENVSVFSGLFSIFHIFLSKLTGQEDIVIGINSSGRMHSDLENVIGMFVKTLPIRFKLDTQADFRTFSKRIHQCLIESMSRQVYDLVDIVGELNKTREKPIGNLFDAMFVFRNFDMERVVVSDVTFIAHNIDIATSKYPITLFADEDVDTFNFRLEYSSLYFSRKDIELLIKEYKSLIKAISGNIDGNISEFFGGGLPESVAAGEDVIFNF